MFVALGLAVQMAASTPASGTAVAQAVALADEAAARRGNRSEVLVLGTAHLSSLPKSFDRNRFRPLLQRLAGWRPDRIATETLSGWQCDYLRSREFAYPGTAKDYCYDPLPARSALRMDGAAAEQALEVALAKPLADRPPAERRRLAGLFMAAGDPNSALVQWLRLPLNERRTDSALPDALVAQLVQRASRLSEDTVIAAQLAVELGHERIYPVDDHSGDRASGPVDEAVYARELPAIWENPATKQRKIEMAAWDKRLAEGAGLIGWYRWMNGPDHARMIVGGDFGAAAGSALPGNTGRKYLAYWETRNMRMAANIREVVGPGGRVLALVGVSHKPYYERYLTVSSDLVVADLDAVLR